MPGRGEAGAGLAGGTSPESRPRSQSSSGHQPSRRAFGCFDTAIYVLSGTQRSSSPGGGRGERLLENRHTWVRRESRGPALARAQRVLHVLDPYAGGGAGAEVLVDHFWPEDLGHDERGRPDQASLVSEPGSDELERLGRRWQRALVDALADASEQLGLDVGQVPPHGDDPRVEQIDRVGKNLADLAAGDPHGLGGLGNSLLGQSNQMADVTDRQSGGLEPGYQRPAAGDGVQAPDVATHARGRVAGDGDMTDVAGHALRTADDFPA